MFHGRNIIGWSMWAEDVLHMASSIYDNANFTACFIGPTSKTPLTTIDFLKIHTRCLVKPNSALILQSVEKDVSRIGWERIASDL